MKAEIVDHNVCISLPNLLDSLTPEAKRSFIDYLSCEEEIIKDVSDQLLDGWTEAGSHGAKDFFNGVEPRTALDKARRELALRAGETAKDEIKDLIYLLEQSEQRLALTEKWAHKLTSMLWEIERKNEINLHVPMCSDVEKLNPGQVFKVVRIEEAK